MICNHVGYDAVYDNYESCGKAEMKQSYESINTNCAFEYSGGMEDVGAVYWKNNNNYNHPVHVYQPSTYAGRYGDSISTIPRKNFS